MATDVLVPALGESINEGDTVSVGAVIARIDENATAGAGTATPAQQGVAATETTPAGAGENPQLRGTEHAPEAGSREGDPSTAGKSGDGPAQQPEEDQITTLSPAVRRAVLEHHVDPTKIKGTGKDGRLTKDDVIAAARAQQDGSSASAVPQARAPSAPAAPAQAATAAPKHDWVPAGSKGERREGGRGIS